MSAKLILDALAAQKNILPEFAALIKPRKPRYSLNGRPVCDVKIERGATRDVVDCFIAKATWDDDAAEALTDEELEQLQEENADTFTQKALEGGAWH